MTVCTFIIHSRNSRIKQTFR